MKERLVTVRNKAGIHCRPSSVILNTITQEFPGCKFTIVGNGNRAELNSILALIAMGLTFAVTSILPFVLAFAAGAMIYVVVEELIPEANSGEHSNLATIGLAVGFALMMALDVALG